MPKIESNFDRSSNAAQNNKKTMRDIVEVLKEKTKIASLGGTEEARQKHIKRGKLLPRERVEQLIDTGSCLLYTSRCV